MTGRKIMCGPSPRLTSSRNTWPPLRSKLTVRGPLYVSGRFRDSQACCHSLTVVSVNVLDTGVVPPSRLTWKVSPPDRVGLNQKERVGL